MFLCLWRSFPGEVKIIRPQKGQKIPIKRPQKGLLMLTRANKNLAGCFRIDLKTFCIKNLIPGARCKMQIRSCECNIEVNMENLFLNTVTCGPRISVLVSVNVYFV